MARGSDVNVGVDQGLTVACVLSEGPTYTYEHVERLEKMANDYAIHDEFVCIDNSPYPGWFAKISLFEPGRFTGRVLYLDLDVTVVGDLNNVAWYPGEFVAIRDYIKPGINSSVMSWDAGKMDRIYTNFTPDVMDRLHGDQDWIGEQVPNAQTYPYRWCLSYRKDIQKAGGTLADRPIPDDARVIVYHGFPKPWDLED